MKIKKGRTRIVFVFNNIVIKFAIIDIYRALKTQFYSIYYRIKIIKNEGLKEYRRRIKELDSKHVEDNKQYEIDRIKREELMQMEIPAIKSYEFNSSTAMYLFGGIMANLQEYKLYRETKNVFTIRTYFSFFGLINFQKKGKEIDFWKGVDVWMYIHDNSQNHHQPFCDGHTLSEIDNFCLDGNCLKMVDYGSRHLEPFLKINGENLYRNFKIPK